MLRFEPQERGDAGIFTLFENVQSIEQRTPTESAVSGKHALSFVVRGGKNTFRKGTMIWIDADTRLPTRIEFPPIGDGRELKVTWSDFVFDEHPDMARFSVDPPDEYQVVEHPESTGGHSTPSAME